MCVVGEVVPITLGLNIQSLSAQRRLADTSDTSTRVFERLASGLRITRAADDAAGLAIAESLRTDARVYSQGIRNFNDGLSLLTIADAAIEELIGITTRIAELAEQAANGTYSSPQRKAMDAEGQTLSKEFFRISRSAQFNGIGIFDGQISHLSVQGGYGSEGGISSSIGGALGTGRFAAPIAPGMGAPSETSNRIVNGDFNGDGRLDVAIHDPSASNQLHVALGQDDGTFLSTYIAATGATNLISGDFNGDGILDLGRTTATGIGILLGKGDGTFNSSIDSSKSHRLVNTTGDFNSDGILDILAQNDSGNEIAALLGQGDGTFRQATAVTLSAHSGTICEDFDNDGTLDIAVSGSINLQMLRGRGDGTFQSSTSFATAEAIENIAAGDFNNDGIIDVVTRHKNQGYSVLLGTGGGNFSPYVNYAATTSTTRAPAIVGDVNGDGALDILGGGSNSVQVLLNRGNGTFEQVSSYAGTGKVNHVSSGDFNSDGVLDLVTLVSGTFNTFLGTTREGINPILPFSLKTMVGARQALPIILKKREILTSQRGTIGALQSRLGVGVSNLTTKNENYLAAASRVRDTDVAQDAAEAVRLRILKESAASILAQANQSPALALTLLRS